MRSCGECAYKALEGGKCPFFHLEMKDDEPGCVLFSTEIRICALCGNIIPKGGILERDEDDKFHLICGNCLNASPCETCHRNKVCYFQTDHTCQEPPMITREVRQGNMIMQTQVMNPKRVMATCTKCDCFNEDGLDTNTFCRKQEGCGCKNQKMNWRD